METLHETLSSSLDLEAFFATDLMKWVNKPDLPEPGRRKVMRFKMELEHALKHPGVITPQKFEELTHDYCNIQEQLQVHLNDIWQACFAGGPPIEPMVEKFCA